MKFTDGYWLPAEGMTLHTPYAVYDYQFNEKELILYVPVKKVLHRGDTLNAMLITVTLSSPQPGVIAVKAEHFTGINKKGPRFDLTYSDNHPVKLVEEEEKLCYISGELKAEIRLNKRYEISFYHKGRYLTSSKGKSLSYVELEQTTRLKEELSLGVGELVYGFGERFTAFVKNGQTVDIRNSDSGTASDQAYKNVPFYVSNKRYAVFVNQTEPVSFEVASEKVNRVQFSVPGQSIEYCVMGGDSLKEVLAQYTLLSGRPALVPAWSFGLWLSTSFLTSYDEKTVTEFIDGMKARGIPIAVFHFDCFWMREFHWCDFTWDERMFPDPQAMLKRIKAKGVKICLWINPYIARRSPLFEEGSKNGYLLKKDNGAIYQTDLWQAGMAIVDFTNPAAAVWYTDKLQKLLDMGVDCFKTDFGERIPETGVVWHNGAEPLGMRNFYSYIYNKTVYDLLHKNNPGQAVLFARSATTGGQKFPVHWGGDCESSFESMAESLRGGLSLSLCGFGYWSHDIGGFEGTPRSDVYKRWCAFGLLSSHSRLHGSHSYRVPWVFDEEAVAVLRQFTALKLSLLPYIYAAALQANQKGLPIMRPMLLEFPDDPACEYLDRQYMLGSSLLTAPVLSEDGFASFYLPPGQWCEWFSGETVEGGRWIKKQYSFKELPLYVRPNSIIPAAAGQSSANYNYLAGTCFKVFHLTGQPLTGSVYNPENNEQAWIRLEKKDRKIVIEAAKNLLDWSVELYGVSGVTEGKDCKISNQGSCLQITPHPGQQKCSLMLK